MLEIDYSASGMRVRDDLAAAHIGLWEHVRAPGNWWTGSDRVALVAESRAADDCALCRERKGSLSSAAIHGRHEDTGTLSSAAVDLAHRLRADPGRLSHAVCERVLANGLTEEQYVELVAIVAMAAGADAFARALGVPSFALPEPRAGAPSHHRPAGAARHGAWVATLAAADAHGDEADLYGGAPLAPNIASALSLVPDEARMLARLAAAHYMAIEHVPDPTYARGPLDRPQTELVAARVSALNQCFY
jgi:alkylhydroperoxidase family enzyme